LRIKSCVSHDTSWRLLNDKKSQKESFKIKAGTEYEKYIGKHYEKEGYKVIYNGLIHEKKDNGIDLICQKDSKLLLVQCKNWITLENFKLTSKDIRAFLGDCYAYIIQNNISNLSVGFHFIVADQSIFDYSAKKYLEYNSIVKYKVVEFSKSDANSNFESKYPTKDEFAKKED
jgi:hypothetical protein